MKNAEFRTASAGVLVEESIYTLAGLAAEPPAKDLAKGFEPPRQHVRQAHTHVLSARDRVVMAEAMAENAAFHAREALTDVWLEARKSVKNARSHPLLALLFPKGPGTSKRQTPQVVHHEVQRVFAALKDPGMDPAVAGHARALGEVEKAFEKPLAGLADARVAFEHAQGKWSEARSAWVDARVALFGALTNRFPSRPGYVELLPGRRAGEEGEAGGGRAAAAERA